MLVRRATASIGSVGAVAALVLLSGPAWADETPAPEPVVVDDSGLADNPECTLVTAPPGEPTDGASEEPSGEVTAEPGETVTPEAVADTSAEPTQDPTDEPTPDPTDEPTPDPTDEPTPDATDDPGEEPSGNPRPTSYYVCMAAGAGAGGGAESSGEFTGGAGTTTLPFSGAPVGRYAATGLGLVLAGAGTVLVARRRAS